MTRITYVMIAILGVAALAGCTGGDMGNTRGGGAAPGQSGGRDTTNASAAAAAGAAAPSSPAAKTPTADTTKQGAKGARRP